MPNILKYFFRLAFIISVCCFAVYAESKDTELKLNFLAEPSSVSVESIISAVPDFDQLFGITEDTVLSPSLSEYFNSGNLDQLNSLSVLCRGILLDSFSTYFESEQFFLQDNMSMLDSDFNSLSAILADAFPKYLTLLDSYYTYIDRYRNTDWFIRFGRTSVYNKVKTLKEESAILKAAWLVYMHSSAANLPDSFKLDPSDVSRLLADLYLDTSQTSYLIWWYKLNFYMNLFDQPVQKFDHMYASLDQGKISFTDSIELLLLKNQVYTSSKHIDYTASLENIHDLRTRLEEAKLPSADKNVLLLRVSLYESYLCFNYLSESAENPLQVGSGCYTELMRVASDYPDLSGTIYKYISCNNYFLLEQTDPKKWMPYLKRWDLSVIYQTAIYYRDLGLSQYDKVLTLFKAIESSDVDQKVHADMLMCRGHCYLELAENNPSQKDYYKLAIDDFVNLLNGDEFVDHNLSQAKTILQGLLLAVQQLYTQQQSRSWLCETLEPAVNNLIGPGTISLPSSTSNSDEIKSLCFYYALILEDVGQYKKALDYFSKITGKSLGRAAVFHTAYCKYQYLKESNDRDILYREVISPLDSLLSSSSHYDNIAVNAAVLFSDACLATDRLEIFLNTVPPVLASADIADAAELVKFSQKYILSIIDDSFLLRVSAADYSWLTKKLDKIMPLAASMYAKSADSEKALSAVLFSRLISLKISTAQTLDHAKEIISENSSQLQQLAPFIESGQIEKVRNQALILMAQQNYQSARKQWYKIRISNKEKENYFYWEARYWGIACQFLADDSTEAVHSIEVLIAESQLNDDQTEQSALADSWLQRLRSLANNN